MTLDEIPFEQRIRHFNSKVQAMARDLFPERTEEPSIIFKSIFASSVLDFRIVLLFEDNFLNGKCDDFTLVSDKGHRYLNQGQII